MSQIAELPTTDHVAETPVDDKGHPIVGRSPTSIAFERLRKDTNAVICASIVMILVLLGVFAPLICKLWNIDPSAPPNGGTISQYLRLGFPTIGPPFYGFIWSHPLGLALNTANDNLARLLYGLRTSLLVSVTATALCTLIGITVGLVAGFARGALDKLISFILDVFLSFPFLLGALALSPIITGRFADNAGALARAQLITLITILTIFSWMQLARLIRGQVLSMREREFVQAAQVIGAPTRRILFKELLPNLVATIVVFVSLTVPAFVAAEAGLSFLGIGLTGTPSLGQTINQAVPSYATYPLFLWAPLITVMVLVISLNLLGDSVRDAFDPKTRR
jgi:ABC-type dipeptide/oligopeptide/nickel transport system permease subunit